MKSHMVGCAQNVVVRWLYPQMMVKAAKVKNVPTVDALLYSKENAENVVRNMNGGKNMSKSKVHMPKELEKKCHMTIHTATVAAAAAGAVPIPMSDAIPITAAQITMIISLGKIFGITLSQSAAKSIASVAVTQQAGRAIFTNIMKSFPGGGIVLGGFIGAATAAALTEALGWIVADDFYRMSKGEEPENIVETTAELKRAFEGLRMPN